jgi:hypothetical protein
MMTKRHFLIIALAGALLVTCITSAFVLVLHREGVPNPWDNATVTDSERRGQQIVDALYAYRHATGRFPDTLDQLVPDYFEKIEPPTAGTRRWRFERPRSNRFVLAFDLNQHHYPTVFYDSDRGKWYHDN